MEYRGSTVRVLAKASVYFATWCFFIIILATAKPHRGHVV